jgi:hypothetical protein
MAGHHARVVDQDVDPAEARHDGLHHPLDLGVFAHVARERRGLAAAVPDATNDVFGGIRSLAIVDRHLGPLRRKRERNPPPDPPRSTRHQRNPILQVQIHATSRVLARVERHLSGTRKNPSSPRLLKRAQMLGGARWAE